MKKSSFGRGLFLWAVVVPAVFWGIWNLLSRTNPVYMSERSLWSAEVLARRVSNDPSAMPPLVFTRTFDRLKQVIVRYPGTESAAKAQFMIGEVYAARKEYPAARKEFERVISSYPGQSKQVIVAYRAIALTYQKEKDWARAVETYRTLLKRYPLNLSVQNVPVQIIELSRRYLSQNADQAVQEAVAHYKELIRQAPPRGMLAFAAHQFLAGCYLQKAEWRETVQELETLIMAYPQRREVVIWLKMAEGIYSQHLKEPDRMQDLAGRFAQKYPQRRQLVAPWLKASSVSEIPPASKP